GGDGRGGRRGEGAGGGAGPADGGRRMIRIERRLEQPRWLSVVVPVVSVAIAFVLATVVLVLTHHPPLHTFRRLFQAAFLDNGSLTDTVVSATPLAFTGLCAAVAF